MTSDEFVSAQFVTLREEIRETKARLFRIVGFGLVAVPAAQYLGRSYGISYLIPMTPFLVMVIGLMYVAECEALMRAGCYIRNYIEPAFRHEITGWETWLEQSNRVRRVDRFVVMSFLGLFFIYYAATATAATIELGKFIEWWIAGAAYFVGGVAFGMFVKRELMRTGSTSRILDSEAKQGVAFRGVKLPAAEDVHLTVSPAADSPRPAV
jgi:hypothetical protein